MRDFKQGILNLVTYFKLIWNTREWDHAYLYEMIEFKLRNMANYLEKYGHSIDNTAKIKRIRTTAALLNRLANRHPVDDPDISRYMEEIQKYEYWEDSKRFKGCRELKSTPEAEPWRKKFNRRSGQLRKQEDETLAMFSRYFAKYSRTWWD